MKRALLAVALAALAGCVEPPTAEELPGLVAPLPREVFLTSLFTLDAEAEENGSAVPAAPFFQAWQAGTDYPTWRADPPQADFLATALEVTLYLRASGPVLQSARFPDVMVYAGAGDAWMGYGGRTDLDALVPGRVYRVVVPIDLPEGGLWLSPEAPLGIKVVPVMLQQDEARLEVLVGGESGSRARLESARTDVARGEETRGAADGEVVGTIYAGPAAPATTSARVPLPLPRGATAVLAWMNTTGNHGVPDLDLALEGPEGRVLAASGTPLPREALRVAHLAPGDHALVVTTAGSPRATFRLEWTVDEG